MGRMTLLSHSSNKKSKNPSSITTTAVVAFPIAQVIPGCLYFTSFDIYDDIAAADNKNVPKNDAKTVYIDIDSHVHYDAFYDDFGPLNLAVLYRFCQFLHTLVLQHNNTTQQQLQKKRIFLYTSADPKCRVNAVYLVASYMIIYHQLTAEQAYVRLQCAEPPPFIGFRDAAIGPPSYLLHVQHVIKSIEKALKFKWLDFSRFDADEYEHFERVENGDLNWIVPGKLLSFCGPHDQSYVENGYPYHSPEVYFDYFRANNVSTIVRLNKKIYDAKRFTDAGFAHHDLFFIDGSTPTEDIVLRFLDIVDSTKGAIAVHCKAGLGRTGCMIACWMMKHYRLTAPQCMAWLRVCRPGSVIGPQQQFLIEKQAWCWNLGLVDGLWSVHRINGLESEEEEEEDNCQKMPKINGGFTSSKYNEKRSDHDDSTKHTSVVMEQETALNEAGQSQGDRLCEIKARAQLRQHRQQQPHGHEDAQINNQQSTATPPLSSSSASKFVSPFDNEVMLPPDRTTTTRMSPMPSSSLKNNKNGVANCCYSSATTPIKQLKLSSTVGSSGHAPPAFVKINNSTLLASNQPHRRRPVSPKPFETQHQHRQRQQQPQYDEEKQPKTLLATDAKSTSNNSANNSKNNNNNMFLDIITPIRNAKTATTTTSAKNPIAVINRLPIHKVSVSSTGRQQHSYQHYTAPSRAQLHRKHFSAAVARLKPYQASECETAHRFASELASTAHASAQHNYGKSLKKQYSAISAACQQQKRHKQQQHQQMMTMMMMNNSCSTKGTLTVAASSALWAVPAMDGGCGSGTPKCNENKNINTNNNNNIGHGTTTNCKYELRPRDQLNLPARFALEQPSSSSSLPPPNGTTNNNSNTGNSVPSNNNNNNSPYLITRHQKASKSATAFFPTSSRL